LGLPLQCPLQQSLLLLQGSPDVPQCGVSRVHFLFPAHFNPAQQRLLVHDSPGPAQGLASATWRVPRNVANAPPATVATMAWSTLRREVPVANAFVSSSNRSALIVVLSFVCA
jgi:hypothetical protein